MKTRFLQCFLFAIILFVILGGNNSLWGQSAPQTAEEFRARGWTHYQNRNFARAIADFDQAISLNPSFYRAYNERGIVYQNMGDSARAIADYSTAIRLDPNRPDAYINRGIVYLNQGDLNRAIADYNEAIRVDPNNFAISYNNRGVAYLRQGDLDRAIADFERALQINPNYQNARTSLNDALRRRRTTTLSVPLPSQPATFDAVIRLFPVNLQGGFREIYTTLITFNQTEAESLSTIYSYYLCNWIKVNIINAGKGNEIMPDGRTAITVYNEMRVNLIVGLGEITVVLLVTGRLPGGNDDWDTWGARVISWL